MGKYWHTLTGALCVLGLAITTQAIAQVPYVNFKSFDLAGDSVTGGGEWSLVTSLDDCTVYIYRLNFADMTWGDGSSEFAEADTIAPSSPATTCPSPEVAEFGASSSLSYRVAVVGLPAWDGYPTFFGLGPVPYNDAGGVEIFLNEGGNDWATSDQLNDTSIPGANRIVLVSGALPNEGSPQDNARFGQSVSINRIDNDPAFPDEYLIAVGAPGYDSASLSDNGRVYIYTFTVNGPGRSDNQIALRGIYDGSVDNERAGSSVTTRFPYVLVGSPQFGVGTGKAVLLDVSSPSLPPNPVFEFTPAGTSLVGANVSLSAGLLLIAGAGEGFGFGDSEPAYNDRDRTIDLSGFTVGTAPADVSQDSAAAVFGTTGTGALLYRDFLDDNIAGSGSTADDGLVLDLTGFDANVDPAIGFDVRAVAGQYVWFADPANERALLAEAPCGWGKKLPAAQYVLLSIPCDLPAGTKVSDLFSDVGDRNKIRLYNYDQTLAAGSRTFSEITDGETLISSLPGGLGTPYGFFLIVSEEQYWAVPDLGASNATFTASSPPSGAAASIDSVRRVSELELPLPVTPDDGSEDRIWVIVSNPFPRSFSWNELSWLRGSETGTMADTLGYLDPLGYVYDPEGAGVSNAYRTVAATTPPFSDDRIAPYEAFYVKVQSAAGQTPVTLRIPQAD